MADEQNNTEEVQGDNLPKNKVDVTDSGTLKKKITITVPKERIDAKRGEMFGELAESAQIPGFRIGRAPRRLIEKRFGREITDDVRNALVGEALGSAIEETELKTIGEPMLDLEEIELPEEGDMEFSFEVEVQPEFENPDTEGITVEKKAVEINDARVDEWLENWRNAQAHYEDTDEAAEEGDAVVCGVTISGDDIETVERHGQTIRVAPGQIEGIPMVELADKLKGKKAGDTVELSAGVGENHPNEDWQGKDVKIEIEISQVRRRVMPELNEEFAENLGFETIDQLKDSVRRQLEARQDMEVQGDLRDQICQYLLDNTDFELPEGVVGRHTVRVLQRRTVDLLYRGVPREQIEENLAELQAQASEEAKRNLKLSFILGKIADEKEVMVGPEEINNRIAQMAMQQRRRPERLKQELAADGTLDAVADSIREEKTLDMLLEGAEVVEASEGEKPAKEEETEKKAAKKSKKKKATKKKASKKSSKKTKKTDAEEEE
ncbi:MAG: trigger factor [Phycisphaerae bacterium]